MSKHTPGPWVVTIDRVGCPYVTGEEGSVARVLHATGGTRMANARLIAAAPELLEALRIISASPVRDNGMHDGTGRTVADVCRAAIAKVTGEKP